MVSAKSLLQECRKVDVKKSYLKMFENTLSTECFETMFIYHLMQYLVVKVYHLT